LHHGPAANLTRGMSPKPQYNPKARYVVAAMIAVILCSTLRSESQLSAQDTDQSDVIETLESSAAELLKQLDSPTFKDREEATAGLVQLGPDILKQLIVHFFESSSEAGWRIHRVLEGIGKNGEEEDFLKSIAIIQVLYGAQDAQSQSRLAKLQYQWKSTRRAEAARELTKQGFRFNAQFDDRLGEERALERARIEFMVRAAAGRELGAIDIATGPDVIQPPNTDDKSDFQWKDPRADRQQSILKIEKIIAGDAETNRQIVEALLPPAFKVTLPPGILEFPKNWKPDKESIKLVSELSTLSSLTFRNQLLDNDLCEFLSKLDSLQGLQLIDCEFGNKDDEEPCQLKLPKSIAALVFEGSLPPAESLPSLGQIGSLKLARVPLSNEFATALSRCKIQRIELEQVSFDRATIRRVIGMRGLFRVTMSLCKFDLEWFEDVRKRNPNLIAASPKAFLGVQGPIDISGREVSGCQISQVVPNTAASDAGMQSLDVVTAMDGMKIKRFEDLRLLISQKQPGDTMKLQVLRGKKKIDLEVKLGSPDSIR